MISNEYAGGRAESAQASGIYSQRQTMTDSRVINVVMGFLCPPATALVQGLIAVMTPICASESPVRIKYRGSRGESRPSVQRWQKYQAYTLFGEKTEVEVMKV